MPLKAIFAYLPSITEVLELDDQEKLESS